MKTWFWSFFTNVDHGLYWSKLKRRKRGSCMSWATDESARSGCNQEALHVWFPPAAQQVVGQKESEADTGFIKSLDE